MSEHAEKTHLSYRVNTNSPTCHSQELNPGHIGDRPVLNSWPADSLPYTWSSSQLKHFVLLVPVISCSFLFLGQTKVCFKYFNGNTGDVIATSPTILIHNQSAARTPTDRDEVSHLCITSACQSKLTEFGTCVVNHVEVFVLVWIWGGGFRMICNLCF